MTAWFRRAKQLQVFKKQSTRAEQKKGIAEFSVGHQQRFASIQFELVVTKQCWGFC